MEKLLLLGIPILKHITVNLLNHSESEGLWLIYRTVNLNTPVVSYSPYKVSVLLWFLFVILVVLILFPHYVCSLFSYVWIPESPFIWERAADSVYHLCRLFTDVTS